MDRGVLETLLTFSPLAVCAIEMPTMRFIAANENYCRALREPRAPTDIIGRTVYEVLEKPSELAIKGLYLAHNDNRSTAYESEVSTCIGSPKQFLSGVLFPMERRDETSVVLALLSVVSHRKVLTQAFHELRTPLTALKASAQFTSKNISKMNASEIQRNMKIIDEKTSELSQLIDTWPGRLG